MDDAFVAYVIGAKPRFTETTIGTIISVPLARRALVIQAGRGQPEFLDRDAVGEALEAVRDQRSPGSITACMRCLCTVTPSTTRLSSTGWRSSSRARVV